MMREVLSRWIKYQTARCKPRSVHLYKIVRRRFSLAWGNLRPKQITTLVVEEFQEGALLAGLSPRTINMYAARTPIGFERLMHRSVAKNPATLRQVERELDAWIETMGLDADRVQRIVQYELWSERAPRKEEPGRSGMVRSSGPTLR